MYAITLRYKRGAAEADAHIEAHRAWLEKHYAAGHFLLSGRQQPRIGGFILAATLPRDQLDRILAEDAFAIHDVAEYEITAFAATMTAPALSFLAEKA